MATGGNGKWVQPLVAAGVVIFTAVTLLGLNGTIQSLQQRVNDNKAQIETFQVQIESIQGSLTSIEDEVNALHRETQEIASVRQDILQTICVAAARNARDRDRCLDAGG